MKGRGRSRGYSVLLFIPQQTHRYVVAWSVDMNDLRSVDLAPVLVEGFPAKLRVGFQCGYFRVRAGILDGLAVHINAITWSGLPRSSVGSGVAAYYQRWKHDERLAVGMVIRAPGG